MKSCIRELWIISKENMLFSMVIEVDFEYTIYSKGNELTNKCKYEHVLF